MGILQDVLDVVWFLFSADDSDDDSEPVFEKQDPIARRIFGTIFLSPFSPLTRRSIFILSCIAVSLDPLFFYILIIDEKDKCLGIDKNLRTAALIFRALPDATLALRIIISGYKIYTEEVDDLKEALVFGFVGVLTAISLMLPIPQLAITVFLFEPGGSGHSGQRMTVSIFIIIYYMARVFLINLSSTDNMWHAGKWVRAALNLFLYIVASHVIGGFWYFFSIQREISCWDKYCQNTKGCSATYYCSATGSTWRNTTFINELCPTNPPNATALNFGIFFDAIESKITRSKHFTTKLLYCLWWGVRNLSNFGTNLVTSTYEWENCFAVVISISGMLLFLYLLGKLQIYLQHAATKSLDADAKVEKLRAEIQTWMETNNVPDYNAVRISRSKLEKTDGEVDLKFICSVVPDYPPAIIQRRICLEKLKGVNKLQQLSDYKLREICKYLKPKIFQENHKIFEAGKSLEWMIYIVSGEVRLPTTDTKVFVGQELLHWVTGTKTSTDPPPNSAITIECSTKVEAFVLSATDLKTLASKGILPKSSAGDEA